MRLSKELIKQIAHAIAVNLASKGLAKPLISTEDLERTIADVIAADLLAEDRLNDEVKKLLAAHEREIAKGQMDYRKVFELTKQKLAKERGMVL